MEKAGGGVRNEEHAESALVRCDKVRRSDDVGHEF